MEAATYLGFLRSPSAARVLTGSVVARLPLGMQALAIVLLVGRSTGSFATAGVAVGALSLANAAAAPVQGRLVDGWGPTRVLIPMAIVQAASFVALVVAAEAGAAAIVFVALSASAGAFVPPVASAARAMWPRVATTPGLLDRAYAVDAVAQEVIWTTGPLMVALVIAIGSPQAAVLLCAVITVCGTTFFATSPIAREWRGTRTRTPGAGAIKSPGLRLLLVSVVLTGCVWGSGEVALVGLAAKVGEANLAGVLLALWSVGSLVGGLAYGAYAWRLSAELRYSMMLGLTALLLAPLVLADSIAAALPLSLLAGLAFSPVLVGQYALTGALAPAQARTEAFTWTAAATYVGFSVGAASAGVLVEYRGVEAAFAVACGAALLGAVLTASWRRRLAVPPVESGPPEPRRCSRVHEPSSPRRARR